MTEAEVLMAHSTVKTVCVIARDSRYNAIATIRADISGEIPFVSKARRDVEVRFMQCLRIKQPCTTMG